VIVQDAIGVQFYYRTSPYSNISNKSNVLISKDFLSVLKALPRCACIFFNLNPKLLETCVFKKEYFFKKQ
jgi:hypothetical protein